MVLDLHFCSTLCITATFHAAMLGRHSEMAQPTCSVTPGSGERLYRQWCICGVIIRAEQLQNLYRNLVTLVVLDPHEHGLPFNVRSCVVPPAVMAFSAQYLAESRTVILNTFYAIPIPLEIASTCLRIWGISTRDENVRRLGFDDYFMIWATV